MKHFLWLVGAFVATSGLFGLGQPESPPVIPTAPPPAVFLAPANPDASQKTLTVPFSPQTTAGRVLMSWTFTVYDSAGRVVWSQSDTQTQDRGFFGELFNIGQKPSVTLPSQLVWDGTDREKPVPNGVYTYVVSVTDSAGKTTRTPPFTLTVLNNPVRITELAVDYAVFSPKGKRKTVSIRQDGSREARWEGVFTNSSGVPVRTLVWENPTDQLVADVSPPDFQWDGKDDAGQVLGEGTYTYTLKGLSRSGASISQSLGQPVVISERPGVLILSSEQSVFSPKAAPGWPTTLTWRLDSGSDDGLVDWSITVVDPAHKTVPLWTRSGKAPLPPTLTFDGKDALGRTLADGRYQAVLSANFNNGNSAESPAFGFELDSGAPQGTLKAASVFGGNLRPSLPVEFFGEGNMTWSLDVLSAGKVVRTLSLGEVGKASVEVPGTDATGKPLADGVYQLTATTHDRAGNKGVTSLTVTKDTRPRKITLNSSSPALVPASSTNATVTITPVAEVSDGVEKAEWAITSLDAKMGAAPVQSRSDSRLQAFAWTGKDASGAPLPNGPYRVSLTVTYANGSVITAQRDLKIDPEYLREPQGQLTVSAPVFGGTGRPTVAVRFQGDPELNWTLQLKDASGQIKGKYPLGTSGRASVTVPDGSEGPLVDGTYTLTASALSKAEVMGSTSVSLRRDTKVRTVGLDLSRTVLVPGKGAAAQLRITPLIEVLDGIEGLQIAVKSAEAVVASRSADGPLTFWDWNGLTATGQAPPDGEYRIALEVSYTNGTVAQASADLKVDTAWLTEPQGTLKVSAPVFGGANRPTVTATFAGDAGVVWTLDVLAAGRSIRQFALGDTGKATVEIGVDAAGKPLADGTYTLQATAKNRAGLTGTVMATVRKDSRPLKVGLDLSTPVLVPGNSLNGTVKIAPVLDVLDSIETTTLTIAGAEGRQVITRTWDGLVPFWDWEGRDALGKLSPDGTYKITLTVGYTNGSQGQATQDLKIDSTFLKEPQGTLTSSEAVFGGSGRAGVTVSFSGNPGLNWTLEILDKDGKTIRKDPLGTSGTATVDFRGLDDQNKPLPDGPYTLRASTVSAAGIPGTALLQLRKDSREGKASLDLSRTVIVPGKGANGTVRITPLLDVTDSVDKTTLTVLGPDGKAVAERSSDGTLPFWDWTGQTAQGRNLPNGAYQVALTVNYANGSTSRARAEVKIDSTFLNDQGPLVEMTLSTKTFAPNNVDGPTDVTIAIKTTEGVVPVDSWQMQVLDPRGKVFRQWAGKGLPPKSVYWDGKSESGEAVESGEDYQILLRVSDTQNHVTRKQETVTIDISVMKLAEGKYKIVVSAIQFAGFSSDVFKVEGDLLTKNLFVLRRIANALGKFPGYKIRLEGYAVSEFWNDPRSAEREQKTQLIPLSLDRATAVRNVMVLLGIDADRFTVQGFGGDRPVVPHSDLENRWKNRRVEFYLDKN